MKALVWSMLAAVLLASLFIVLLGEENRALKAGQDGTPHIAAIWTENGVQRGLTLLLERGPYERCYIARDSHVDSVVCVREAGR
ncbi:MAG: hypothetical protein IT323_22935 [Anaerolineae bacterium]|nr:hypothetical protein [Anaerolineae bacterium]